MRLLLPTSVSLLLLLSWQTARAQTAEDFFNGGAQFYISNNIPSALEKTENGLKLYPNDEKLIKLEKLLKQKQQQNQQNQKQQQKQNQSQQQKSGNQKNQQQQNQQQQSSQQNAQEQNKQNEQKQNSAEQKKEEQQKQAEQKASQEKSNEDKKENQNAGDQPATPGQMTPEEAKRLLDAQKGDEQVLQLKPQGKPQDDQKPVKDW